MTSDNFKEWQKKRAEKRLSVNEKRIEDLKFNATQIMNGTKDFDLMVDEIQQLFKKEGMIFLPNSWDVSRNHRMPG